MWPTYPLDEGGKSVREGPKSLVEFLIASRFLIGLVKAASMSSITSKHLSGRALMRVARPVSSNPARERWMVYICKFKIAARCRMRLVFPDPGGPCFVIQFKKVKIQFNLMTERHTKRIPMRYGIPRSLYHTLLLRNSFSLATKSSATPGGRTSPSPSVLEAQPTFCQLLCLCSNQLNSERQETMAHGSEA